MARNWIRRLDVKLAGKSIKLSDMQAEFMVRQTDVQHPDWAYVRMLNLSDSTMESVFKEGAELEIEAGYKDGNFGMIFSGSANQMRKGKLPNGVDKYLDVVASTGRVAYNHATVNKTLKAGSTHRDIIMEVSKAFQEHGVQEGHIGQFGEKTFEKPVTLFGSARDIARKVAEAVDASWTIFNGKFYMTKNDEFAPGGAFVINANTGMVGMPEQQLNGIVVKIFINPEVKIHQQVRIDQSSIQPLLIQEGLWPGQDISRLGPFGSRGALPFGQQQGANVPKISADGVYKVVRIDHDGSVMGQEWYTTLTCLAPDDKSGAAGMLSNQPGGGSGSARSIPEDVEGQSGGDSGSGGGGGG